MDGWRKFLLRLLFVLVDKFLSYIGIARYVHKFKALFLINLKVNTSAKRNFRFNSSMSSSLLTCLFETMVDLFSLNEMCVDRFFLKTSFSEKKRIRFRNQSQQGDSRLILPWNKLTSFHNQNFLITKYISYLMVTVLSIEKLKQTWKINQLN